MPRTQKAKRVRPRTGAVMIELNERHQMILEAIRKDWERGIGEKVSKSAVVRYALRATYDSLPDSSKILG